MPEILTDAHRQSRSPPDPVRLGALFGCFFRWGCASLLGDPTAGIEGDLVARRGWLSEGGFKGLRVLSRVTPGVPAVNLAVAVGRRLAGPRGAAVALLGMLTAPLLAALVVGLLYVGVADGLGQGALDTGAGRAAAAVQPFLSGLAMASAGLAFAAGVAGVRRIGATMGHAAIILVMVGSLTLWHWPILLVVLAALPLSVAAEVWRKRAEAPR